MSNPMRASIILLLSIVACAVPQNPLPETEPTTTVDDNLPTPAEVNPQPPRVELDVPEDFSFPAVGNLAIVGLDRNIYQANQQHGLVPITADAVIDRQIPAAITYGHPTWSRDGWLSFVQEDTVAPIPAITVMAVHPGLEQPRVLLKTSDSGYIYGYWSPETSCENNAACGRLAYLMSGGTSIELHLAEVSTDPNTDPADEILDRANPFYYSWSADGQYMLWHQNGSLLGIFDSESGLTDSLPDVPGAFQAPSWSPIDDRLLFAVEEDSRSTINIASDDDRLSIGSATSAASYFQWSPDGAFIAHADGEYPLHNLTITNLETQEAEVFDDFDEVISFFWSPDGKKLAVVVVEPYIAPLPEAASNSRRAKSLHQGDDTPQAVLAWWLVNVASGDARRLSQFLATPDQFYVLQYFDQYAQSHQLWSPDSRYLAYAHLPLSGDDPEVVLLDTTQTSPAPEFVLHGLQAIFSYGE